MFEKGYIPWNKGLKGYTNNGTYKKGTLAKNWNGFVKGHKTWNKGKHNTWSNGEKSNFWKGGIQKVNMEIRGTQRYKNWRKKVFEWDKYKCRICGMGGYLNADHYPFSFSYLLKVNNIHSTEDAMNCNILWDIGNGRTLCLECHYKTETFGRKKTYENFI